MMTLCEYLSSRGMRQDEFARALGVSQPTISRLATKKGARNNPSLDLAAKIEQATGGAVPVTIWPPFKYFAERAEAAE
jgi:transcriptional regulator with XRE-family HTH domain